MPVGRSLGIYDPRPSECSLSEGREQVCAVKAGGLDYLFMLGKVKGRPSVLLVQDTLATVHIIGFLCNQ